MHFKFLIFLISAPILFFILSIYNAVVQQVDQKYTGTFSTFLFCNNTSKPPVVFMYNHYVPLIIFSKKSKYKATKQTTFTSHWTKVYLEERVSWSWIISTNFCSCWIYFTRAGKHLNVQSKFMYFLIFVSLSNIDLNRSQGKGKFQSSPSIQICLCYLSVSLGCFNPGFDFFSSVEVIIYNQYFDDITKFLIICSLKMFLSYSTLPYLQYISITYRICVHMTSEWF